MDYHTVIRSQYHATLSMLEQAVRKCPASLWNAAEDKTAFWHVAYHALFYTHLYLQEMDAEFVPWPKHREDYNFIGRLPWPPHHQPEIGDPYTEAEVLEYLKFCREQVDLRVPQTDMTAPSGFDWLPFGKFELQIYTVRHLQQHTGELMERLGSKADIELDWVGTHSQPSQK